MTKHMRTAHVRSATSKEASTHGCVRVRSSHRGKSYQVEVPVNNMDACIKFSWVRCVYSIVGMLLVASDIPRTGYGVQTVLDSFERIAPGMTIYFGPFAYGIAQITKTANASSDAVEYTGTCDGTPIAATDVWSYKFDSLSISLRSVANSLHVLAYPSCLFYRSACPSSTLSLETTFTMLDALASSVDARQREPNARIDPPLVFHTRSYWVDRLGHFLLSKFIWRRVDTRFHAVHHYRHTTGSPNTSVLDVCPLKSVRSPFFCEQLVPWTVDEVTFNGDDDTVGSTVRVKIGDHIAHRFAALERAHAHLTFDMTVFTTRFPTTSSSPIPIIPTVRFRSDNNEVTTVIRGRACARSESSGQQNSTDSNDASDCETMLVDDYRYEIATLETDFEDWYKFTFTVRVLAQLYVWLRLLLLWVGCYCARRHEPAFAASSLLRRMLATWTTVFKIPSHIIIYGSWVPIIMYALAHYMDSGIVHTVCENVLASANGAVDLDVSLYVNIASVQMRNIWYVALVVKCVAATQVYVLPQRLAPWTPHDGFLGVRGSVIGAISFFTMFAFLRSPRFRNADVVSIAELAPHAQRRQSEFSLTEPVSEFGIRFDARMLGLIACLVACGTAVVKVYLVCGDSVISRTLQRYLVVDADAITNVSISRMRLIPYSAGSLAPLSVLGLFWKIHFKRSASHTRAAVPQSLVKTLAQTSLRNLRSAKVAVLDGVLPSTQRRERPRSQENSSGARYRNNTESKPSLAHHEALLYVSRRTPELWSVVKLVNIALLTEPLALAQLYVSSCELYLYHCTKAHTGASSLRGSTAVPPPPERLYLLPCDPIALARHTHDSGDVYELVAMIDSTSVPWHLLILCG